MTPEQPRSAALATKSAAKGKSQYPIPPEVLDLFRERKKMQGVLLSRSVADALAYAIRNRAAWW